MEYSFNIWNWNIAWRDLDLFRSVVDQAVDLHFNTIELGVPWNSVETTPGHYDFSEVDRRVEYVRAKGLALRLRVNVQDHPAWFTPELMERPDGTTNLRDYGDETGVPSIFNDENLAIQTRWVRAVAAHYAGQGYQYTLGIGIHFELKFAGWYNYEPSSRAAFRKWLLERYDTLTGLNDAWQSQFESWDDVNPPVPAATPSPVVDPKPDLTASNADWIRFREDALSGVVQHYHRNLRQADTTARVSAPLGESFRSGSAEMCNQDIHGLSRGADSIVSSYDFFIHGPDGLWNLEALVTAYRGISQLPVMVELDGYSTYQKYGEEGMYQAGITALEAGASGLNVANYTQDRAWASNLSQFQFMQRLGLHIKQLNEKREANPATEEPELLLFLSKWTNYSYRSPSEWVHDYQFGFLRLLLEQNIAVRVITDENLHQEELSTYTAIALPFAVVVDDPLAGRLVRLLRNMPAMQDASLAQYTPTGLTGYGDAAFRVRRVGTANPSTATVQDTTVLHSFHEGDTFQLKGLGQPTDSLTQYTSQTAQAHVMSKVGPLAWTEDHGARKATLGFNAGAVYTKGGYKNQTRDIVLDLFEWLGLRVPDRVDLPDIVPPLADFALASPTASLITWQRESGLHDGAQFSATGDDVLVQTTTSTRGRVLGAYDVNVPSAGPHFLTEVRLQSSGDQPVWLSIMTVGQQGEVVHVGDVAIDSTTAVPVRFSLEKVAGTPVMLVLRVDATTADGTTLILHRPRMEDSAGSVIVDLASAEPEVSTETRHDGLHGGAQFYTISDSTIKAHPPWNGMIGAITATYEVELPPAHSATFSGTVRKEQGLGDGTAFLMTITDEGKQTRVMTLAHVASETATGLSADLSDFTGQAVTVQLTIDAGLTGDPSYDATLIEAAVIR